MMEIKLKWIAGYIRLLWPGHQVTSPPSSSRRRADTVTEIKKIEELPYPPSKQQPQPTPPTSQLAPHHHTERFLFSV